MLTIEYIPITDIKPYERNAKLHPQEQIEQIKNSIQAFGFNDPLGIWHGEIVEGHGRYLAAKELGMTEVPVIRLDGLTDEQRRAYMLVHNQLTMNSGFDLELLNEELAGILSFDMSEYGFTLEDQETTESIESVQEDDYVPRIQEPAKTKPGEIYKLGNHILMCGDSTNPEDLAKLMDGQMADLLLTDPPYNVDYTGHNEMKIENDNQSDDNFYKFLNDLFENVTDNLKPGGAFYIWHADSNGKIFRDACESAGLKVRQCIIWVKNSLVLGRQDYQWQHEPCLYGWKDGAGHYFIDDRTQTTVTEDARPNYKSLKKDELIKLLDDIYSDKKSTTVMHEDKPPVNDLHPTMKPIKLMARQIRNSTRPGESVLDICGGSGSTMMACEQLGRKCYMMELDPHYCDVIIDRWETFTKKKAIKKE